MDANNYECSIDFNKITDLVKIGTGTYGVVFKAVYDNRTIAIKKFNAYGEMKNVERELRNLKDVKHANILLMIGDSWSDSLYSLVEFADGGSLDCFLHNPPLTEYTLNHIVNWTLHAFEAVAYLHSSSDPLVHGDLKPSNMLLTDHRRVLKISDFGSVRTEATTNTNIRTTAPYMAPEIAGDQLPSPASDVFSCSVILWEMLSRKRPYDDIKSSWEILSLVEKGKHLDLKEITMEYPEELELLITEGWNVNPSSRPNIISFVTVLRSYFNEQKLFDADLSI
ncbi:mitogen-activated protein kinase kinase kinase 7 [Drosophila hydei]|uniref:Mitogen-activated protein kinase kinase kinase 7 n=1 Tax=Drosophila hydei TaxID=7224 RepID=A0A6J1LJ35_DROHY|nr:mitogen-activated protein kinase kinase kinase 7 [Drosophila hydei]